MTFVFGTLRLGGSILAVVAGALAWPVWWLGVAIAVHATGGYLVATALHREVGQRLGRGNDETTADMANLAASPASVAVRELALAFVRCGIAFAVGFWLLQLALRPPEQGQERVQTPPTVRIEGSPTR